MREGLKPIGRDDRRRGSRRPALQGDTPKMLVRWRSGASNKAKLRFNRQGALFCEIHAMRCADRLQIRADFRLMHDAVHKARRRMGELR